MIELFVDTETSGFVWPDLPLDHESQPHLVQLGLLLRKDGKEVSRASLVVRCSVEIPEKARAVHGYSRVATQEVGVSLRSACSVFCDMAAAADVVIAHNAEFDRGIMEIAARRSLLPFVWLPGSWFCTMAATEQHCCIPATEAQIRAGHKRRGEFKQPRLEEALKILLGEDNHDGAHDAMADVLGCARLYDWLVARGHHDRPST